MTEIAERLFRLKKLAAVQCNLDDEPESSVNLKNLIDYNSGYVACLEQRFKERSVDWDAGQLVKDLNMTKVAYSKLPNNPDPDESSRKDGKFAFPKITRLKLFGFVFMLLFVGGTIAVTCLKSGTCKQASSCGKTLDSRILTDEKDSSSPKTQNRIKFHHMKKRLPQCLIIGARKSGTRALITYLNIHPDVVTKGKEMHYFDDDTIDHLSEAALEEYRKEMPLSYDHQLTIEKTPAYFTEQDVPELVYRMNNTIRLLLVLREPIERTVSDYLQIRESKIAQNKNYYTFEEQVLDKSGNINRSYKGISRSIYHKHLKRWLEFFRMDQIFIIDARELTENPAYVMTQVEDFLGLAHEIKPNHFYFNKTKGFYCIQVDGHQKCLVESKGRPHPALDPSLYRKLKEFFRPHNEKLFRLLDRNFGWDDD